METIAISPSVAEMLEAYKRIVDLQNRLRSLRRRIEQAEAYLRKPGGNLELGRSQLERLLARRDETLAALEEAGRESQLLLSAA